MLTRTKIFTMSVILLACVFGMKAFAGPRSALVIGNSAYANKPLRNPVNDATDMASLLKNLGFDVILKLDANLGQMEQGVDAFWGKLKKGGVGLFYFAGHGIQVNGKNYLIPVDFKGVAEQDVKSRAMRADLILGRMENAGNELNIIILDSCRNNPYTRAFRSASEGLAVMDAPTGSLLAFSTAPGTTASDGSGKNGVYTSHLLNEMVVPGLPVEELFKRVRIGVMRDTAKKQVPWETSSLTGRFVFAEASGLMKKSAGHQAVGATSTPVIATAAKATETEIQALQDELSKQEAAAVEAKSKAERKKIEIEKATLKNRIEVAQQEKARADAEANELEAQAQHQVQEPPSTSVSLEDLRQKTQAKVLEKRVNREKWDTWLAGLRTAVAEAQAFEKDDVAEPSEKYEAWVRVGKGYTEKNPYSVEDDQLRGVIKARTNFWLSETNKQQMQVKAQTAVMSVVAPEQQSATVKYKEQVVTIKAVLTPPAPAAGDTWRDPVSGFDFVWVPKGCFKMGNTFGGVGGENELPVHDECVNGFWMLKYTITQEQWLTVMGYNKSIKSIKQFNDDPDYEEVLKSAPVENIWYDEIQNFIRVLQSKPGNNVKYRLPTEAEWEYACRSGGKKELYAGGNDADRYGWHNFSSRIPGPLGPSCPQPIGLLEQNGLGLYDMSGNIGQMVEDKYDTWRYKQKLRNRSNESNDYHVVRGSNTTFGKDAMRCSARHSGLAGYSIGFRIVAVW